MLLRCAACAALAAPASAWALFEDRVELWAAENITHDTNVLRLSKNMNPLEPAPAQLDDTIYTTHVGASLNAYEHQQHFTAEATYYRSNFHYFKDFDFDGYTLMGNWAWVLGPTASGTIGLTDQQGLASFNNIQAATPDLVKTRQLYATGNWNLTPRWRANGGLTVGASEHGDEARKVNDIDVGTAEAGLSYVTPLDNSFGVVTRFEHGRLPHALDLNGIPFESRYNQSGLGAMMTYVLSGHSRLEARAEYVNRRYNAGSPQQSYNGPIGRALYIWTPTAKITVNASISRDVGPAEDITSSFVLVTGGYIRPQWQITDKVTIKANAEYNVWDYRGDEAVGGNFTHHQRLIGVSVAYRPTQKILLQAGYNHEKRTSTLLFGDYDDEVFFVEGRIGF
ncbi:MAG TPA: XrtB/PEP-CTERM-associated polysaccharide biosynthesis outer membrane protein EpsL [Usitatibacter sp.]|nr:XrtB/PEP-CTERM-associated polysaccharide biosynthesis outer membrane protein EpsL [Usitatibacter sp.]